MKKILCMILTILCLSLQAAVTYVPVLANKTTGALEPVSSNRVWAAIGKSFDTAPILMDTDAEAYCTLVSCVDLDERLRVARFIRGLKDLGLWTSAKMLVSLSTNHQVGSGSTVYAIKGPNCTVVGSPGRQSYGYTFDGAGTAYLTFVNPYSGVIPQITCIQAFKAVNNQAAAIVSGYKGSPNKSWGSYANGSPTAGYDTNTLVFDYSVDGTTTGPQVAGRYCGDFHCTGQRQLSCNTYGPTLVTQQGNADRAFTTAGTYGSIFNPNTTWEIARTPAGGQPLNGEVAFIGLWDTQLTEGQYMAVRRLLTATICTRFLPKVNVIFEGDSITAGSGNNETVAYKQILQTSLWGTLASKRTSATGGESLATMKGQATTQWLPYSMDNRYGIKTILILNGGINDVSGSTAAAMYADAKEMWARGRANGFLVGAATITPSVNFTAPMVTVKNDFNNLVRSDRTLYDYLLDYAAMTEFADFNNSTYFWPDGVHIKDAGQAAIANKIYTTIPLP